MHTRETVQDDNLSIRDRYNVNVLDNLIIASSGLPASLNIAYFVWSLIPNWNRQSYDKSKPPCIYSYSTSKLNESLLRNLIKLIRKQAGSVQHSFLLFDLEKEKTNNAFQTVTIHPSLILPHANYIVYDNNESIISKYDISSIIKNRAMS